MPRLVSLPVGTLQRVVEVGRIGDDQVIAMRRMGSGKLLQRGMADGDLCGKWRALCILFRLEASPFVDVDGIDCCRRTLCHHEGYQTRSCANIQDMVASFGVTPAAYQYAICSDFHGTFVMKHSELFELKERVRHKKK